jgi:uncharacterized protein YbjQ (UPF0145 family)
MLVVTTEGIPGYEVRAVIGEVVGVTARTFNPFIEGVKSLNGRLNPQLVRLLAQIRQEAVANMVEAARRRGANAVIGMRFDHRGVTGAWNEVCAYGTAVLVASPDQPQIAA